MLSIILRTNQQSSNNVFNFLHILFFLHICTALFTIVNALNNNDNEAIIQLSVDSIHVVKSSDHRFASIEENANDDEEKELLIALLTSFDDDYKNTKQSLSDKYLEDKIDNENSAATNCTSSPTAAATAESSISAIRFIPPLLDFNEQSIAIPRMQTVMIINDDTEPLELHSLSGTTVQFYSSFFTQKTLSSNGGNTTINVYYLPRTLGLTKSTFTIRTNRGILYYYVHGIGTINPFHIRPLIGATIPLNATFEYLIHFYNPYNYSIDINEIYTSDENLIIELLSYKNQKNKITKTFEHKEQWHIESYQIKPIIKINYLAYKLDRLHGFYCIKTNSNDTIVVPVEISVLNQLNLYSNVDILEFSPDGLVRSTAKPISIPVYVINNGIKPVTITDVRVSSSNMNYATIHHEKVQVPAGIHHFTKIAELTLNPNLIPADVKRVRGSVQVYTSSSFDSEDPVLQIPFRATVFHGSLDYEKETTYIYIPPLSTDSSNEKKDECQSIKLINRFNTSLVIYNITTDKMQLISQYIEMKFPSSFVYANAGESIFPLCIKLLKRPSTSAPFINLEASLTLHTNLSYFHFPVHLYSGLLGYNLASDGTNGGIKRNDTNPFEYFIASIPVNESRTVKFVLINANPIDITIEKISITLPKTTLQLVQMQSLNGTETKMGFKNINRDDDIIDFVFPARQQAIFALNINGVNDPSFYSEKMTFKTRYETVNFNLKYRITSGSIELDNKLPVHIDVFPDRLGTADIFLRNNFDEPTDVARIEFPTYGKCFSFIWNNSSPGKLIIEANATYQIGKLRFDMIPLCSGIQTPSESTCYCGLNNHPEFKQRWDQHVSALNTYELDHVLVTKFRNLWKEWTSLVRKQRIQTNIWLETDQANTSWPVTIGFVWPSVLEHMTSALSRTPVILDFHLTLINTTKTQNVIITNPSSSLIQYSIELISNYENQKNKKKGNSVVNNQVFDITKTSKRVELIDGIYKFSLSPNEHIIFTASYRPKLPTKQEIYLVVRNNLTIIESILLRGEGGSGSLTVGNRNAGSSDIPLVLEMNEKQYKLCSNYLSTDGTHGNPILQKVVTLRNTGNMKAIISDVSFGRLKCFGQGFSVNVCSDIEIEPNERYDLRIRFQPDYTLAEIGETLTLNTNIGLMTFPIIVRIPQRVLATCYQTIPRPGWELRVYWLCLCSAAIILLYIITVAVYDARRLFNDYMARAELRSRMPVANPQLFDLTDLTAAVQDEQKTRDRIESRTSTSTINTKKDISKDENKTKENEIKVKRPTPSANGSKDNGETTTKTLRSRDGSDTPVRSVATSPKAVSQKTRRSTTDLGLPKPSKQQQSETPTKPQQSETPPKPQQSETPPRQQQQSETPPKQQQSETPPRQQQVETPPKQQQHETPPKSQTFRTQKAANTEQSTVVAPLLPTPPSTISSITATDEENGPFVVPRPKRVSGKTKDSTTNIVPVKVTSTTDSVVPLQPTPPPPAPPLPQTVIPKPATRSDLSEQRQHQPDVSRSSDSISDQQWHMVSSNRGLRKGSTTSTTRRETTDESQTTNKTNKTTSNNPENPMVSSSSSRTHASVSNQVTQSRRRRGRRPARTTSPIPVPTLTKRQSSQTKAPLGVFNRELAFRQLTEQLWAAGLPSATTACSMSVRSRCSSAPPSERGGGEEEMIKFGWNDNYYDDYENIINWDEPDKPDEDFGRYIPQPEQNVDESNSLNGWTQQQQPPPSPPLPPPPPPPPPPTTINDIPPLMSIPTNVPIKITMPSSINKEDVEPLPFPQHGPGPIQRPNKLTCPPIQQLMPSYSTNPIQSPGTPDVLDQINRLLDHQNSTTTTIAPPTPNVNRSSVPINDLTPSNVIWSTFSPTEWSSKYDSSWPLTSIQSPTVSLTTQVQNPFAVMSTINEQQRQPTREENSVWSSVLGTATPRLTSSSTRTQRASTWNELFSSTVPSATESTKPTNNSWLKYWSAPDPSSADGTSPNGHDTETHNPFWSLNTLSNGPVVPPPVANQQQASARGWWPNASSDENNNENRTNHLNDDTTNNRDQSRWDFAR